MVFEGGVAYREASLEVLTQGFQGGAGRSDLWQLEEAVCHGGIFPSKFAVYPDLLEGSGYEVGLTGKGWGPGDFKIGGRTRNPAGPRFDKFTQEPPASGIGKLDYPRNFAAFLEQHDKAKPFG